MTLLAALLTGGLGAQEGVLSSGDARLVLKRDPADGGYPLVFEQGGRSMTTYAPGKPLSLEVDGERIEGRYTKVSREEDGALFCEGSLISKHGTRFLFADHYLVRHPGSFELQRSIAIKNPDPADHAFNSLFGIGISPESSLEDREYFVPGVWYRTNFKTLPGGGLAADPRDHYFLFREDRLPLPLVMAREIAGGHTVSLIHVSDAEPSTFSGDRGAARVTDERMQFGSIGVRQLGGTSLVFMFPGSEGERNQVDRRASGEWALRSHPVKEGVTHRYKLVIDFSKTATYAVGVAETWRHAFDFHDPQLRPVAVEAAFQGLIDTLAHYAVGSREGYDAPGFPFSVHLPDGKATAYNYQMGFIGRQLPNAFILLHQGIEAKREDLRDTGTAIVDFWAENSLLPSGLPRTWYDPARGPAAAGTWRSSDNPKGGTAMRVATTGMEGLLSAWELMSRKGAAKPAWLAACRGFGDWLVENQNEDGSYYRAYSHRLTDGRHLSVDPGKSTTPNPIRFLARLHHATGDPRYKAAAIRAGEFSLTAVHSPYRYAGSVIDNPDTLDRESGQEAISAFLSLHDLTGERRWLDAAVQAACYTETWMYSREIPAEIGSGPTDFPADRSIVGQTLIATGQSAADLGLAFSSFDYYRLYLFTGDTHFLKIAKLLVHNTKQALNWDGTLYPGQQKGLQLEAFSVTVPRRKGIMECLSWNYTAHLDPLVRFQDTFGFLDIDEIEKMPLEKRRQMNRSVMAPQTGRPTRR